MKTVPKRIKAIVSQASLLITGIGLSVASGLAIGNEKPPAAAIDRVTEIRRMLLDADRCAQNSQSDGSTTDRYAQWLNWPNYWANWPNWANWNNWNNWMNWRNF
jgi:hypothetical protein